MPYKFLGITVLKIKNYITFTDFLFTVAFDGDKLLKIQFCADIECGLCAMKTPEKSPYYNNINYDRPCHHISPTTTAITQQTFSTTTEESVVATIEGGSTVERGSTTTLGRPPHVPDIINIG